MPRRSAWCLALALLLACTGPAPPAAPTSAPAPPTPTVMLQAVLTMPPGGAVAAPTPLAATPPDEPARAQAPTAGPSPTAIPGETIARAEDAQALAAAPAVSETRTAATAPTVAALPPSARQPPRQAPTAVVLSSSPPVAALPAATLGTADYNGAIKLVQDSRKAPGAPRLEERINAAIARARANGSEVEVVGWQAALKGTTTLYQVTFALRENRQGLRAEWEVDLASGAVRPSNPLAEALDGS